MKKLNCTSCGGHLEVESNNEYAICRHCGARYKLNEDLDINFKVDDSVKDVLKGGFKVFKFASKMALIPICMFFIIFITVTAFVFKTINNDSFREERIQRQEKDKKESFNFQFANDNGTKPAIFVESTLDEIIKSNKTNDKQIELIYEGKKTSDEKEIINIKHSLSGTYEVSINYDSNGYINQIIVDKIN